MVLTVPQEISPKESPALGLPIRQLKPILPLILTLPAGGGRAIILSPEISLLHKFSVQERVDSVPCTNYS